MPRARKEYETVYTPEIPPSQRQMWPHSNSEQSGRNFRVWNNQYNQFNGGPRHTGRGQFPPGFNANYHQSYHHPNFQRNGNGIPRGPPVQQNGFVEDWNIYDDPDFDHQPGDWRQEKRRDPSYRASCLTRFDNSPYPPLRNLKMLCPSDFEPGGIRWFDTRVKQDGTGQVNSQSNGTNPESQNVEMWSLKTGSKLDSAQALSETNTRSDANADINTHKTDQNLKSKEHQHLAVGLDPNVDKTPKLDQVKNTNRTQVPSRPGSTTPEAESLLSFSNKLLDIESINKKTRKTDSISQNTSVIDVIDLTADIFEKAAQVQPSFNVVSLVADINLPLQLHPAHSNEAKDVPNIKKAKAERKAATLQTVKANGESADSVISTPLYITPPEDQDDAPSPNMTANTEIVQVPGRELCEDTESTERRDSIEDDSKLLMPMRKEDFKRRDDIKRKEDRRKTASPKKTDKYVVQDVDMRVKSATTELSPYVLSPKLPNTGRTKKDDSSKISSDAVPGKKRKGSIDKPPALQAAVDVHREETNIKEIAVQNTMKRRKSSSSDASDCTLSDCKRNKLRTATGSEKCSHSRKDSSKSRKETAQGITATGDEITSSIKKATSSKSQSEKSITNSSSLPIKDQIDQTRKSESKHRSSGKTGSKTDKAVDGKLADVAQLGSTTINAKGEQNADSKMVDKNKIDNLATKVKHRGDSNASLQKSNTHHSSSKPSSGSAVTIKMAATSQQKSTNLTGDSQQKLAERKTLGNSCEKSVAHKPSMTPPAKLVKCTTSKNTGRKITENGSTQVSNQKPLSKPEKDSLKRICSSDKKLASHYQKRLKTAIDNPDLEYSTAVEMVGSTSEESRSLTTRYQSRKLKNASAPVAETSPTGNVTKAAGSSKKATDEPVYKMSHRMWQKMGMPSLDSFKAVERKRELPMPTIEVVPLSIPGPDAPSVATVSVAVGLEKTSEQLDECCENVFISAKSVPPEMVGCGSTDSAENIQETSLISETEIEDKSLIKRFQGSVNTISEAHIPVITIFDDEYVPTPVLSNGVPSTVSDESSAIVPKTNPHIGFKNLNFKEEMELNIDDSNFPPNVLLKEELNDHSEDPVVPAEGVVEDDSHIAPSRESAVLWPCNYQSLNDFPGRTELTKLVEYLIILNQDLIKYNDSYRIASRLDEIQRRFDERLASRDLVMVIGKVKPIIEGLVTLTKASLNPEEDLLELIYLYKEVLPCEALKLKADTLSRKAIADIFRLISEGTLEDINVCQSKTVIVYNREQDLISPKPLNLRYESVIRNISHKPIDQDEMKQCAICRQRAMIPCRYCDDINVCSKSHLREHQTNFHSMSKSVN